MARPTTKKKSIEDAAIRLFAEKGLAGTTLKDIAREAGATEGALYRHYKSKDSMAYQLFDREIRAFAELMASELDAEAPWPQRLEGAIRAIYGYYEKQPEVVAFILLGQHNFPDEEPLPAEVNPNDMAARFVALGMADGVVPKGDPALLASMLLGAILQPMVWQRYGRLELGPQLVDGVVSGCRGLLGFDN